MSTGLLVGHEGGHAAVITSPLLWIELNGVTAAIPVPGFVISIPVSPRRISTSPLLTVRGIFVSCLASENWSHYLFIGILSRRTFMHEVITAARFKGLLPVLMRIRRRRNDNVLGIRSWRSIHGRRIGNRLLVLVRHGVSGVCAHHSRRVRLFWVSMCF